VNSTLWQENVEQLFFDMRKRLCLGEDMVIELEKLGKTLLFPALLD
jgi:hypothetical protein